MIYVILALWAGYTRQTVRTILAIAVLATVLNLIIFAVRNNWRGQAGVVTYNALDFVSETAINLLLGALLLALGRGARRIRERAKK